ncbi:kinase-like protein [Aspergillus ruber CBS 135680]|uniref:non-specific serine/threonine protein kinase n=1 Tax=Aspergillus ruber (strain CBS 135680) TaxID=1388766 RepID=A0A017S345_ASPRC|nr:kinase-like protein [Aspergillus ruber CBS 135680]EYE91453.1 kinase-like protein [Aspergillus ruber CBS 135680]
MAWKLLPRLQIPYTFPQCQSYIRPPSSFSIRHPVYTTFRPKTHISSKQPKTISTARAIKEEILHGYIAERYYPVYVGQIFNSRYQIITKLGFGATSTIWLCLDLQENRYLTLKLHVRANQPIRELQITQHLQRIQQRHGGEKYTRVALDSFQLEGPHGVHHCLVYEPAGMDMNQLLDVFEGALPMAVHKTAIWSVLVALDYLHNAGVVHTDVQSNNILLGLDNDNESILDDLATTETTDPTSRKYLNNRTIYTSRTTPITTGEPVLCDLGEARLLQSNQKQNGLIMPAAYRAPEVLLDMDWDEKVDIWAVGQTAWSLFEKGHLFLNRPLETDLDHAHRFAEMISLLGPPPLEFLRRSEESLKYWDENGNWRGAVPVPEGSLEDRECQLDGHEKVAFLSFIRRALCWVPEVRASAWELLCDEWVRWR